MTKSPQKIAFIKARWHADIVDQALVGFKARLAELGIENEVVAIDVPGAFEMPLLAQNLGQTGEYAVIAAAALVVDGGIYRHDFVAQAVVTGLMEAQMKTGTPVLSVSLGDTCLFRIGETTRSGRTVSLKLDSGDVIVLGGAGRLCYHGVDRIYPATSALLKNGGRINLTLRRVTRPTIS